jgi:hypothetical protein
MGSEGALTRHPSVQDTEGDQVIRENPAKDTEGVSDQVIRENPAGAVVVRAK